jgi:hypothetical protein
MRMPTLRFHFLLRKGNCFSTIGAPSDLQSYIYAYKLISTSPNVIPPLRAPSMQSFSQNASA